MMNPKAQSMLHYVLTLPIEAYVILAFSVSYLFFFVRPVFFNSCHVMQFIESVPAINPIGVDLKQTLDYSEAWAIRGSTPYIGTNTYPPAASVLFAPLLFLDFFTAYRILTLITLLCFASSTLLFPLWIRKERNLSSLLVLIFITGVFSYGFQFELERGQFNVIAFFLCLLAVYIYHYHHKWRYVAYLLFSISIQLKLFPAIFIIMFVRDWRDWKGNLKRILAISASNCAALFVLGLPVFTDFVNAVRERSVNPYVWRGNHSIKSFVTLVATQASGTLKMSSLAWVNEYRWLAEVGLLSFVGICLLLIILRAYQQNTAELNPFLLMACTIGALLIPSVSHDYKLSMLPASLAIALRDGSSSSGSKTRRLSSIGLVSMVSLAYSSTLFSYMNKPLYLANNLPALVVILLAVTALYFTSES